MDLEFTGECFIPGKAPKRIEDDHLERYRFACRYAEGKTVLDIACGVGYGAKLMAEAGALRVDGVDLSPAHIAYAKEHHAAANVRFLAGDIRTFRAGTPYDVVVSFETIEHVPEYRAALASLHALLRPGGTLLISSPNRPLASPKAKSLADKPGNKFHAQEFTIDELTQELLSAGFQANRSNVFGQRQQRLLRPKVLMRLYNSLLKPGERFSPVVTRVDSLAPRYFILVAMKQGAAGP
ncbi:MAG: methyltransferase domain-containing protein [Verrucomicrobiota bacterium]